MKRLLLLLLILCNGTLLMGDERSDALLKKVADQIQSLGDYRVSFRTTVDGESIEGEYYVSGEKYCIQATGLEVICDGSAKYEISTTNREVVIDPIDPEDRTILGNPTRIFDFLDGSYTHTYVGDETVKGERMHRIELQRARPDQQTEKLTVFLDRTSGLPVELIYYLDNINTDATVEILSIEKMQNSDPALFSFDRKKYRDYEVIDFR